MGPGLRKKPVPMDWMRAGPVCVPPRGTLRHAVACMGANPGMQRRGPPHPLNGAPPSREWRQLLVPRDDGGGVREARDCEGKRNTGGWVEERE